MHGHEDFSAEDAVESVTPRSDHILIDGHVRSRAEMLDAEMKAD